jgi:hypothetical protein
MQSAAGFSRAWRVLLALVVCLVALPAQAQAMELMVAGFGRDSDSVRTRAYVTSGYVGARYAREIVERGAFYDGAGNATSFNYGGLDRWVDTAVQFEMKPYLTLTNRDVVDPTTGRRLLTPTQRLADPAKYGAWCGEVANRYSRPGSARVLDYSVWNEPNLGHVGNLAADAYLNYYVACRLAIHQVNPSARIYYGELSTGEVAGTDACAWLYDSTDGATVTTEGVAVHPYQFTVDPTADIPGSANCEGIGKLDQWPASIARAGLRAAGGATASLLVSEFGYCSARTPAPAGDPYLPGNAVAACPQNAGGVASVLTPATHATWLARAWTVAGSAGATLFNYHTLAKRNQWEWRGGGGYIWESGILDNPTPAGVDPYAGYGGDSYGASVEVLRSATGTQSPTQSVAAASNVSDTTATLNGTVNPNGNRTTYWFEYGPGNTRTAEQTLPAGTSPVGVSANIGGLAALRTYDVRLFARSRAGQNPPAVGSFTTSRKWSSFNGDRLADLIIGDPVNNAYAVALSDGNNLNAPGSGIWQSGWGSRPVWAGVGDFNGDHATDFVVSDATNDAYAVTLSTGGGFGAPGSQWWLTGLTGRPNWGGVGDFNGDSKDDLVIADPVSNSYVVSLSDGTRFGAAGSGSWITNWGSRPDWAGVGDFNGDGKDDVIVTDDADGARYGVAISDGERLGAAGTHFWLNGWSAAPNWGAVS